MEKPLVIAGLLHTSLVQTAEEPDIPTSCVGALCCNLAARLRSLSARPPESGRESPALLPRSHSRSPSTIFDWTVVAVPPELRFHAPAVCLAGAAILGLRPDTVGRRIYGSPSDPHALTGHTASGIRTAVGSSAKLLSRCRKPGSRSLLRQR